MATIDPQNKPNSLEFGNASTQILETYRSQLFAYCRTNTKGEQLLALCNFAETAQSIPASICDILGSRQLQDLLSGKHFSGKEIELAAYDVLWLKVSKS